MPNRARLDIVGSSKRPGSRPSVTLGRCQNQPVASESESPESWDARAEIAVGLFIRRYLADDAAPAGSRVAPDLEVWAEGLLHDGQARLAAAGARPLRVARS